MALPWLRLSFHMKDIIGVSVLQRGVRSGGRAREDHGRPPGRVPGAREEQPDSPLRLAPPALYLLLMMSHPVVCCRRIRAAAAASLCGVDKDHVRD